MPELASPHRDADQAAPDADPAPATAGPATPDPAASGEATPETTPGEATPSGVTPTGAAPHAVATLTTGGVGPATAEPRSGWIRRLYQNLLPESHQMPVTVTFLTSLLLAVGFLSLPLAGTDLSAQVARGHFFEENGFVPIDFRWYGGIYPFGYSAFTGPANAVFGSRGVGVLSCVISAVAFAWLLARVGARRPLIGGVLGAVVGVFNLVSGRTTFAMGIAVGMLALCLVTPPWNNGGTAPSWASWLGLRPQVPRWRLAVAAVLAALSTAASPVAGLFVGLAGAALLLSGRIREGLVLGLGAGAAMGVPLFVFRDGGVQPFSEESMKVGVAACVAVVILVPRRYRAVRIGAVIAAAGTAITFYLDNPLGSNVIRLPMLYAAPVVVAVSMLDRRALAGVVALLCWWQPPLVGGDLAYAGAREASRLYFQPLIDQLDARQPVGRVEVVPLRDHWESTYVADAVPIARGWERQVDVDRNAVFYDGTLTPATYLDWLYDNAVSWVAVPRESKLDFAGREEAALIEADLSYLRKEWENADWRLYRVIGGPSLVQYPGRLIASEPTGVRFSSPVATAITIRVRWSPWLVLRGPDGCVERGGKWTTVRLRRGGEYRLTGSFAAPRSARC